MFETEIVSNFQRLSNLADFNKMSTKENSKKQKNLEILKMLYILKLLAKKPSISYQIMADCCYNCEKVLKCERFQKVHESV